MPSPNPSIEFALPPRNSQVAGMNLAFKSNGNQHAPGRDLPRHQIRQALATILLCGFAMFALISRTDPAFAQNNTIFGPNVYVFTPSNSISSINSTLATLAGNAQFSTNRYAVFFAPGTYNGVESQVGYYMS